ncbi:MAG: cbb3-type cytochrome oxidase subunit 3 [Telluria sp.]|jgi:cytochrome c oxidase cbb3-type subunit 4
MDAIFNELSRAMTVVSMATFLGILAWTFSKKRSADFAAAEQLPFADDEEERNV